MGEKAQQENHYQSIVDKNEEMEKNKQDYNMESEQLWNEIEEAEIDDEERPTDIDKKDGS